MCLAGLALSLLMVSTLASAADYEYLREGNPADAVTKTRAGYVLAGGGGDVAEAFQWMIERSGGGDFLVLRASGSGAYNPFVRKQGKVNSAATLILKTREASWDPTVLEKIRQAEAIFFAGGDQWNYIRQWKHTPLQKAIQERIDAGVPVGGTSAGLAILGESYFPARFDTINSAEALSDAFHRKLILGSGFLRIAGLEGLVTDSHFAARNRMGRLVAFLARMRHDGWTPGEARGLGIDEATAVLLDPGEEKLARVAGRGSAYFVRLAADPDRCLPGQPLEVHGVEVYRIDRNGSFHLSVWKGEGGMPYQLLAREGELQSTQEGGRVY